MEQFFAGILVGGLLIGSLTFLVGVYFGNKEGQKFIMSLWAYDGNEESRQKVIEYFNIKE